MKHIREVNGLRGIAIISVIFEHLHLSHIPPWLHDKLPTSIVGLGPGFVIKSLYWNGWLAVNLFFVLSGFVLFLPYASGTKVLTSGADWRNYYWRRAARLLPLFFIAVSLCTVLIEPMRTVADTYKELGFYYSGLFHFTSSYFWPLSNIVLWSLGVEIWFSVIFPVVACGFFRLGAKKTLFICFVFAFLTRLLSTLISPHGVDGDMHLTPFKDSVLGRVDDFAIGMAVALLYVQKRMCSVRWMYGCLLLGGFLTGFGAYLWSLQRCHLLPSWSSAYFNIPINLGFAAFLLAAVSGNLPKLIGMALRNSFLQLAGMMCYSIYVWHYVILKQYTHDARRPDVLITFFIVTFLIALLSYRYIEFGDVKDWKKLFPMFFPAKSPALAGPARDSHPAPPNAPGAGSPKLVSVE